MKKLLSLLLVICMLASVSLLFGCGDAETPNDDQGNADNNGDNNGDSAGSAKDQIKIGVIHIGDPADGSGYSYTHDLGIQAMQKNLNLKDSQIVRKLNINDSDSAAIRTAIEECIADGCNLIFGTSYGYMDTMEDLAAEYPEVYFSHGTGYKSNETNFNNYFGRIYQARYLSGIAAGLKASQGGKIGYVSAYTTTLAETSSGINAFALGVQAVNPTAEVYVKNLESWFDPEKETSYAQALLDLGCEVIAQHCDTANPQITAQSAGKFGCGYNSDMTEQAPEAHLTAPIWHWGVYYTTAAQAVIDGKFAEMGNYYGGLKEGFVDLSPLSKNCVEGTAEKIEAVRQLIVSGEWDVFSGVKLSFDAEGKLVKTDADLKDNAGNVIVAAGGASVADGVIQGTMNYLVAGVSEK